MKRAAPRAVGGTAETAPRPDPLRPAPAAPPAPPSTLLIACGALAREIVFLTRANHWRHLTIACLPAHLHNTPQLIPDAVRRKIRDARGRFQRIAVLYGDCGSGGLLDKVLQEEGVERIAGPHCYEFYAGTQAFATMMDEAPGSFFLTDYLTRHFDRLVMRGLGLDRHPELLPDYFQHYTRLVYLAQTDDPALTAQARKAAERLGLAFERRFTGYGGLATFIAGAAADPAADSNVGARGSARAVAKRQLAERFEKAIDRAAMRAGKRDTDSYLAEWRRADPLPCGDDLEAEAASHAAQLEAEFTDERLDELVKSGGVAAPAG